MVSETSGGATQYLIYDGQNVVLDFNGSGTLTQRQLNGPAVNQVLAVEEVGGDNPGVNWLLADAQGSVRDVVRGTYSDGATTTAAVDHVFLDAFGDQTTPQTASDPQDQTQIGFAGMRYIAAVELYMTPNRPYDPSTGDWLQPDPAGSDAGQTNLFEYCGNSPTNATDPSGLMANLSQGNPANWGPLKGTDIGVVGNCGCAMGDQIGLLTIAGWSGVGESGGTVIPVLGDPANDQFVLIGDGADPIVPTNDPLLNETQKKKNEAEKNLTKGTKSLKQAADDVKNGEGPHIKIPNKADRAGLTREYPMVMKPSTAGRITPTQVANGQKGVSG
jgi:RHS repeat-associated protein